jgi:hypothetical protein
MLGHTEAERGATGSALQATAHLHAAARRRRASPLARGILYRLAWAGGLSVALWLAVFWALT